MAADVPEKQVPVNLCCRAWRDAYSKLQEKRNALRQALKLVEPQLVKIQADNVSLKKACEEERARALSEKEGLENEISVLKSDLLKQKGESNSQDRDEEIKVLQVCVSEKEKEISELKEMLEKEKTRADSEKKNAEAEKRRAAEALKQKEGSSVQDRNEEVKALQVCALEKEKEISQLKELLDKAYIRAESEKKNAEAEKKRAAEAWKYVKSEKGKADEERRRTNIETNKAEEYRLQLESLRKEADDAKSNLVSEKLKMEEANKKLEAEKQKVTREKKRAVSETGKAKEQSKLAEDCRKKAEEEKCRADKLSQQLELLCKESDAAKLKMVSERRNIEKERKKLEAEKEKVTKERKRLALEMAKSEDQRKVAEANQKQAEEEKCRADNLSRLLEEARQQIDKLQKESKDSTLHLTQELKKAREKIDELQKQLHDLSSKKHLESAAASSGNYLTYESGELELLKKQLKFERMRVKHAKQVTKLEKHRNRILQQELGRFKLDFVQFSHRLEALDKCFSSDIKDIDNPGKGKVPNCSNWQMPKQREKHLQGENGFGNACCLAGDSFDPLEQTHEHTAPLPTLCGRNCNESLSGIDSKDSKLESLLGGSSQKMLQSSAINSSSTTFSDGQFVGSQGRGSLSVTTSSKLIEEHLNAQPTNSSMCGEVTRIRCDENHAVAEDSARSPLKIGGVESLIGQSRKRKRILEAFESLESLHVIDRNLHVQIGEKLSDLHDMVNRPVDTSMEEVRYLVPNLEDNTCSKYEQLCKKRKASHGEEVNVQRLCISNEPNKTEELGHVVHESVKIGQQASYQADNPMGNAQMCVEGISDSVSGLVSMENFEELANGDYMKLLDLDDPVDEECYRAAIESPISPTLPEIEFQGSGASDTDKLGPITEESLLGGFNNGKGDSVSSGRFDVINVEINSNELNYSVSSNSCDSSLFKNRSPLGACNVQGIDRSGICGTMQAEKVQDHQGQDVGLQLAKSNLHGSGDTPVRHPFGRELRPAEHNFHGCFVVCPNIEDNIEISRIVQATKSCLDRCLFSGTEWVFQKILLALKREEQLCSKEKACVLFSLLLINFLTAAPGIARNFLDMDIVHCLDSFAAHTNSVVFDSETRSAFGEFCLDELLGLIEEFVMDGRVITFSDVSAESPTSNSKTNIIVDGVNSMYIEAASADQLVAGSIILVSICAATDRIGFICEASYNISRMHICDPYLVLAVLHIFAHVSGKKFFSESRYSLTNTILKSIVTYLEDKSSSAATTHVHATAREVGAKFHPCSICPFSEEAVSIDVALTLLLEKLQSHVESGTSDILLHKDQARQGCQEFSCVLDRNCDASGGLNKSLMPASRSESTVNSAVCHVSDVLSLVELLACNVSWIWTYSTVAPQLLRVMESPIHERFAVPVVILLGQLGRIGVDACGYEDKEVESLRNKLSSFLWRDTTVRAGPPLQIATVASLLGLISLNLEQVIQPNFEKRDIACQSTAVDAIKKWFSSLNKDHQAFSYSFLQRPNIVISKRR